jgi:hypothetical protein
LVVSIVAKPLIKLLNTGSVVNLRPETVSVGHWTPA